MEISSYRIHFMRISLYINYISIAKKIVEHIYLNIFHHKYIGLLTQSFYKQYFLIMFLTFSH